MRGYNKNRKELLMRRLGKIRRIKNQPWKEINKIINEIDILRGKLSLRIKLRLSNT